MVDLAIARDRLFRLVLSGALGLGALALGVLLLIAGRTVRAEERTPGIVVSSASGGGPAVRHLSSDGTPYYLNCRFGVGQADNPVISYDVASLNLGWYGNWRAEAAPARPGGIEYVQVLRVSDGAGYGEQEHPAPPSYSPSGDALAAIVAANPGSLWLVGNEPDCIWQDNVLPENYAVAYHDAYAAIKAVDPNARVSAGGIVQPTPIRMQYLDAVLDAYVSRYGASLPTDAWNVHTYILREASCAAYPDKCWGSEIPPGISADAGKLYALGDTDDIDIFRERIRDFRRWMNDRGYRNTPLVITEYGTLLPYYGRDPEDYYRDSEGDPFDTDRAQDFMYSTFDFLLTASDSSVGYPADENRLVQRWLWYSLDDIDYGGQLFDSNTTDPTPLGMSFADYTGGTSPTVDLLAVEVSQVGPVPLSTTGPATVTLQVQVSNVGNVALTEPFTVRFLDEEGQTIGGDIVVDGPVAGCAETSSVKVSWPDVVTGAHTVRAIVDPEDAIDERDEANNEVRGLALVAEKRIFLPLTTRGR